MIGWYVDVGIYPGTGGEWPNNISDINILDTNRPLVYFQPTGDDYKWQSIDDMADYQAATISEELLGDEYYTLYTLPSISIPDNVEYLRYLAACPSFPLSFPNLFQYEIDNDRDVNRYDIVCCYFKKLNKILCYGIFGSSGTMSARVGNVSENGNIVYTVIENSVARGLPGFNLMSGSTGIQIYGAIGDFKAENIWVFRIIHYTNGKFWLVQQTPRPINTAQDYGRIWSAIFTDADPDFSGNIPTPDPMEPIGPSGPGGGNGNFDNDSDIIGDSSLPTISAADTGFTRIYSPTLAQVQDLAQYLWTDETVVETIWNKIKQLLENPMDAIISFSLVPVPVQISGTKNFALAYIDTGVAMNTVANQFVDVDCGTFELKEYYGSALDYSPNTKVSCFLPFIGVVTLNTDEVMNTTLTVKYRVDIVSGSCVAKIFVNESCLYQFSGHCSIPIPISAADFSSYLSAAIGVAKLAIGAAVGGGAGAAAAGASEVDVEQATRGVEISEGMSREQEMAAYQSAFDTYRENNQSAVTTASFRGISAQNVTNVVGTVMGSKLHVEHSGSFSGNTGYLGIRRPYLIIQRPRMCMPNEYRSFNGYPSMITLNIGDCKGYTKVQQVQLKNIPATNPEQSEIMQLLKGGIII